ncbi:hypothetical protein BDY17DRAFT_289966 [Neohortaea acidophila]|uniref:Uncharacterized protein n=1 Tax=Neohortaea acidophila TaxID=245834 RepID=A0A6A6Q7B6_9PEZI|nr:uncharacterized protein BDY17DRAFT_289966 [Neohortaea acidophila]KAF2487929.1 hypothetical protein BDY17DRAFT_289966 [Neohortaea acidophila]
MAISGWGIFLIILVLVVIGGVGGYVFYAQYRAKKLGLPPPNLNPFHQRAGAQGSGSGGFVGWISDQVNSLRRGRTAGGAYEGAGLGGGSGYNERRGFGALEPDEAWNARVDDEAGGYYEEQELGLQDPSRGPYGGGGYGEGGVHDGRGRSRSRDGRANPFGDHAEESNVSLRTVSPRPDAQGMQPPQRPGHKRGASNLSVAGAEDSPTERRSMFREDV